MYTPGENRGADTTDEPTRLVQIGKMLLGIIDYLVDQRSPEQLIAIDGLIVTLQTADVWASDLDLESLGEYAEYAAKFLREGQTPEEIKASDYRKRAAE